MDTTARENYHRLRELLEDRYRAYQARAYLRSPLLKPLRLAKQAIARLRRGSHLPSDNTASAPSAFTVLSLPDFGGEFELPRAMQLTERVGSGVFENYLISLMKAAIQPGDHVIDVGANLGLYAVMAGKLVGPSGRVLAAEPVPSMLRLLEANVVRNALTNVTVYHGVVSDREGPCTLSVVEGGEEYSSIGGIAHPNVPRGQQQQITVESETLDSLVARYDLRPTVVKVDTEGAEGMVFARATETLRTFRPIVFSELDQRLLSPHGSSARAVAERWFEQGYLVFNAETGEPLARERFPTNFVGDVVALRA